MSRGKTPGDRAGDGSPLEPFYGMVGRSPVMREVYALIERIARAPVPVPVLILGESGTGKELAARAIWSLFCPNGPFIPVNCGAIPTHLVESELFGHEKGAFTGADRRHTGYLGQADGGILFLDEVPEFDQQAQVKLLRAIELKEYQPVGAERIERSDFRLVAATTRNLDALVAERAFRADLFYRLDGARITLPPLRDRPGDIPLLAEWFLGPGEDGHDRRRRLRVADSALALLQQQAWPGNVRQLRNVIEAGAAAARGATVEARHLRARVAVDSSEGNGSESFPTLAEIQRQAEADAVHRALEFATGDRALAARLLGISQATLYRKLASLHGTPDSGRDSQN